MIGAIRIVSRHVSIRAREIVEYYRARRSARNACIGACSYRYISASSEGRGPGLGRAARTARIVWIQRRPFDLRINAGISRCVGDHSRRVHHLFEDGVRMLILARTSSPEVLATTDAGNISSATIYSPR